jgi:hypothetical protein
LAVPDAPPIAIPAMLGAAGARSCSSTGDATNRLIKAPLSQAAAEISFSSFENSCSFASWLQRQRSPRSGLRDNQAQCWTEFLDQKGQAGRSYLNTWWGRLSGPANTSGVAAGMSATSQTAAIAIRDDVCVSAFGAANCSRSGTEFLQHVSTFAVGGHVPLGSNRRPPRGAPPAKHLKGPSSKSAAIRDNRFAKGAAHEIGSKKRIISNSTFSA